MMNYKNDLLFTKADAVFSVGGCVWAAAVLNIPGISVFQQYTYMLNCFIILVAYFGIRITFEFKHHRRAKVEFAETLAILQFFETNKQTLAEVREQVLQYHKHGTSTAAICIEVLNKIIWKIPASELDDLANNLAGETNDMLATHFINNKVWIDWNRTEQKFFMTKQFELT